MEGRVGEPENETKKMEDSLGSIQRGIAIWAVYLVHSYESRACVTAIYDAAVWRRWRSDRSRI